ncbi:MAG: hypothetical protein EOM26_05630 [Alphaproteobacteria bacterium]|nr:hypothetical protein [Alphaproteobacteria bacterium]
MAAYVVFTGETDLHWLRLFLKPGYRHCFLILHDGRRWVSLDPLAHCTELTVYHHLPGDFDLPDWLAERGLVVVPARLERSDRRPAPAMVFTCVEAVKRVLGLHARYVLTPWQLCRHLQKSNENRAQKGDVQWAV